jgi:hypothetical protein
VVGDGDAVGVGTEIAQNVFWAAERRLGVDHPVVAEQQSQLRSESSWFSQWSESAVELDSVSSESALECSDELTAEHAAEHLYGKEEGPPGTYPAIVIGGHAAGGHHAVHMRVMLQALIPGMEHAEEADVGAEMTWITSDLQECFGAGLEQQVIDEALVLQRDGGEFTRQREHDMHIACGQQFSLPRLEPAHTCVALASWAMPVSARVI